MADYIRGQEAFRRKCVENGADYFEIDRCYEEEIKQVYEYIDVQKKEKGSHAAE